MHFTGHGAVLGRAQVKHGKYKFVQEGEANN